MPEQQGSETAVASRPEAGAASPLETDTGAGADGGSGNRVAGTGTLLAGVLGTIGTIVVSSGNLTRLTVGLFVSLLVAYVGVDLAIPGPLFRLLRPPAPRPLPSVPASPVDDAVTAPRIRAYAGQLEAAWQRGRGQAEWLVLAPSGYGKTCLLGAVHTRLVERGALVLWVTVSPVYSQYGYADTCLNLAEAFASNLARNRTDQASEQRLLDAIARARRRADAAEAPEPVLAELAATLRQTLRDANQDLAILVDDLHHVVDRAALNWLASLCRDVLATRTGLAVFAGQPECDVQFGKRLTLVPISSAQAPAELCWRLGQHRPSRATQARAQTFLTASNALPFSFDQLCQRGNVSDLPDNLVSNRHGTDTLAALDKEAGRQAGVDRGLPVSDWLAVLDRFGDYYLKTVLEDILQGEEGLADEQAERVVRWLRRQRHLVQPLDNDEARGMRLMPMLQEIRRGALTHQRLDYLHAVVEREYWKRIDSDPEDLPAAQLSSMQLRFEAQEWRGLTLEWMNHAKIADSAGIRDAASACTHLLLKQFFWWDVYVPSAYREQLLKEYERRWPGASWVADLRTFCDNYVPGSFSAARRMPKDEDRWRRADAALASLLRHLDVAPSEMPSTEPDLRAAYCHIALLRADTCRFQGPNRVEDAMRWLDRAAASAPEDWMLPWVTFLRAQTRLDAGEPGKAKELAGSLEEQAVLYEDNDLRICVAQLLSDLAWGEGLHQVSIDYLARAVLIASGYHLQQECDGETRFSMPNEYSRRRHQEAADRLTERLSQADKPTRDDARRRIDALFAPYWQHVKAARGTRQGLLPPPPSHNDTLGQEGPYFEDVQWLIREMSDQLNLPLGTPLPQPTG